MDKRKLLIIAGAVALLIIWRKRRAEAEPSGPPAPGPGEADIKPGGGSLAPDPADDRGDVIIGTPVGPIYDDIEDDGPPPNTIHEPGYDGTGGGSTPTFDGSRYTDLWDSLSRSGEGWWRQ